MTAPHSAPKYEIVRKIATGGMGELYLALKHGECSFTRQVVLKRLHKELENQSIYKDFFIQEGVLSGKFHHPNIVQVYDLGEDEEGLFMVMEYIMGKDLMSLVRKAISQNAFIPLPHALSIISQIGEGLSYVHTLKNKSGKPLGLVHRDVTPQNIIVTADGFAKLVDFGVASVKGTETSPGEGLIPGKINYMAPELLSGAAPDPRADIFSLGVMLYELTVGKRLFKGDRETVKDLILSHPTPMPTALKPDMEPELEQIIMRSLEKDPDLRFQTAREMVEAIERFALGRHLSLSRIALSTYLRAVFSQERVQKEQPTPLESADEIPINLDARFLEEWSEEGAMGAELPEYDLSEMDDESYFELMADPEKFAQYVRTLEHPRNDSDPQGEENRSKSSKEERSDSPKKQQKADNSPKQQKTNRVAHSTKVGQKSTAKRGETVKERRKREAPRRKGFARVLLLLALLFMGIGGLLGFLVAR